MVREKYVKGRRLRLVFVLHGESSQRLAPPRNPKDTKHLQLINPIDPTDTPHRPSTKHYRKDSPGLQNTN